MRSGLAIDEALRPAGATTPATGTAAATQPGHRSRRLTGTRRLTGRPSPCPACEAVGMTGSAHRKLVLLRHAKSAWPDLPDHERPLAGRGRRDAPVMGRWLRTAGHVPDQVLCSTARRA